ncbi:MAG: hypothetical protein AB1297_05170 [bacterium]
MKNIIYSFSNAVLVVSSLLGLSLSIGSIIFSISEEKVLIKPNLIVPAAIFFVIGLISFIIWNSKYRTRFAEFKLWWSELNPELENNISPSVGGFIDNIYFTSFLPTYIFGFLNPHYSGRYITFLSSHSIPIEFEIFVKKNSKNLSIYSQRKKGFLKGFLKRWDVISNEEFLIKKAIERAIEKIPYSKFWLASDRNSVFMECSEWWHIKHIIKENINNSFYIFKNFLEEIEKNFPLSKNKETENVLKAMKKDLINNFRNKIKLSPNEVFNFL